MTRGRPRLQFVLRAAWTGLLVLTLSLSLIPTRFGTVRLVFVVALPALTIGASAILWQRRRLRLVPLGVLALGAGLVLMPGRDCDRYAPRESCARSPQTPRCPQWSAEHPRRCRIVQDDLVDRVPPDLPARANGDV